ncbi:MAG: tetratricopeptide repeat protein [Candidatus Zixiibacteriota bacterium]
MNRCPNCKTEILFESAEFCEHCGVSLVQSKDRADRVESSDDMEFEVSEANPDHTDDTAKRGRRAGISDDLGVQSSAELVEHLAMDDDGTDSVEQTHQAPAVAAVAVAAGASVPPVPGSDPNGLLRLSADEVKKIEQRMYGQSERSYLSEDEKRALLKNMQTSGHATQPPSMDGSSRTIHSENPGDLPRPQIAKRSRGVAFFVSNWIQVQGGLELHEMDEIQINDRTYLLKKKKFSPRTVSIAAGVMFMALLFVVGSLFVSSATDGKGELIGVVLDANLQPNQQGATVKIADLGQTVSSNEQGFFKAERIPAGSHKIEYIVDNQVVGTDYATVTAGQTTTLTLRPAEALAVTEQVENPGTTGSNPNQGQQVQANIPPTNQGTVPDRPQPTRQSTDPLGKISLHANVDGAKFSLNGSVLGAGNLTYSRIKAGRQSYSVTADGYQTVSGTIEVAGGETQVLQVDLVPASGTTASAPKKQDELEAAMNLLRGGQPSEAITAFTAIVEKQPSEAAAYASRGDAYMAIKDKKAAEDDYVKAAEIFRAKKVFGESMTQYNNALRVNPNSITAFLGRASLHIDRNEEIAAITDYESVLKIDKHCFAAYYGLGQARYGQGNYKEAIRHFKDARSESPDNAELYQYLMLAYMGDDDLKGVKKSYEKFKELANKDQLSRLQGDKRYDAVLRVVSSDE